MAVLWLGCASFSGVPAAAAGRPAPQAQACGEKRHSFGSFLSLLAIMRNDILNLIRFCPQRNWICGSEELSEVGVQL